MNKLIIYNNSISIETNIVYKAIEIRFSKKMVFENLMPDDYIVSRNDSKLLIIKFNLREEIIKEILKFVGENSISRGFIVDQDNQILDLKIVNKVESQWSSLDSTWDSMTTKYEDIDDNSEYYTAVERIKDPSTKITKSRKIRRKVNSTDKKMTDLNKFISKHDRQPKTKKTTKPTEKIRSTY